MFATCFQIFSSVSAESPLALPPCDSWWPSAATNAGKENISWENSSNLPGKTFSALVVDEDEERNEHPMASAHLFQCECECLWERMFVQ